MLKEEKSSAQCAHFVVVMTTLSLLTHIVLIGIKFAINKIASNEIPHIS